MVDHYNLDQYINNEANYCRVRKINRFVHTKDVYKAFCLLHHFQSAPQLLIAFDCITQGNLPKCTFFTQVVSDMSSTQNGKVFKTLDLPIPIFVNQVFRDVARLKCTSIRTLYMILPSSWGRVKVG